MYARQWQEEIFEFMRIRHPSHAVVQRYQLVFFFYLLSGHTLWGVKMVFDHFEHDIIRRQGKNGHYHSFDPRGKHKLILTGVKVVEEIPVKFCLAMFVKAYCII